MSTNINRRNFQPTVNLSDRGTSEENSLVALIVLAIAFWLASWICTNRLHGTVQWYWFVPYCRF